MRRFIIFFLVAAGFCCQVYAEKPYSPFDEPKPRIPKEITEDKCLDVKVNVYVKGKSFRDLFAEIRKQTGVRLTTERSISAERAIIYFHARPLRDVMTEISSLFGYYWLPKGKEGSYSYELFEDTKHEKHRNDLRQARVDTENALFLELLRQSANLDSQALKNLEKTNADHHQWVTSDSYKQLSSLLSRLGTGFVSQVLIAGRSNIPFASLPADAQAAILEWRSAEMKERWAKTHPDEPAPTFSLEDMARSTVQFNRIPNGMFGMPRIEFSMRTDGHTNFMAYWPSLDEADIRTLTGEEGFPEKMLGDKLPDDPAITITAKRKDFRYGEGHPTTYIGDTLQAIADQSGKDIIADYYFQDMFPRPANKEPLGKMVKRLCDELDYSCRVEGSTLTFRFNKWYVQPLQEEPSAKLVEAWWNKIETVGRLELYDLLDLASLPDKQMLWTGFRLMPGQARARKSPATMRLWNSLRPELERIARSEEGLSLAYLSQEQLDALHNWGRLMQVDPSADWTKAVIKITKQATLIGSSPETAENVFVETFKLEFSGGLVYQVQAEVAPVMKESDRKDLAAQRKADAEADKVEVVR